MTWEQYDAPVVAIDHPAVERYWADLAPRLRAAYSRPRGGDGWRPWADGTPETVVLGLTRQEVAEECTLIHGGVKTAWTRPRVFFDGIRRPPRAGEVAIVVDGAGHPCMTITIDHVAEARFGDVDEEYAEAEALGEFTLADWRRITDERFAAETGLRLDDDSPLYLQRFSVV